MIMTYDECNDQLISHLISHLESNLHTKLINSDVTVTLKLNMWFGTSVNDSHCLNSNNTSLWDKHLEHIA